MSIHINRIEGSRKSACLNDAYAVTEDAGGREHLLGILPGEDLDGKTIEALRSTFLRNIEGIRADQASEAAALFSTRFTAPKPA